MNYWYQESIKFPPRAWIGFILMLRTKMKESQTCDDIDVGVEVFWQADTGTVPIKAVSELLLHSSRATESVQTYHLTHTPPTPTSVMCWAKQAVRVTAVCLFPPSAPGVLFLPQSSGSTEEPEHQISLSSPVGADQLQTHLKVLMYPHPSAKTRAFDLWGFLESLREAAQLLVTGFVVILLPVCPIFPADSVWHKEVLWVPASHRAAESDSLTKNLLWSSHTSLVCPHPTAHSNKPLKSAGMDTSHREHTRFLVEPSEGGLWSLSCLAPPAANGQPAETEKHKGISTKGELNGAVGGLIKIF